MQASRRARGRPLSAASHEPRPRRAACASVLPPMARKSLRPHLNQIRTWTRQGRTDAWVAHQLEVTVQQIASFKREAGLLDEEPGAEGARRGVRRRDRPARRGRRQDRRRARGRRAGAARGRGGRGGGAGAARGRGCRGARRRRRPSRRRRSAAGAAAAAAATAAAPARRSRAPSITARRATGSGSTRPSSTTPSTPSTGPATAPSR